MEGITPIRSGVELSAEPSEEARGYVTLRRIREGYTWTIGSFVATPPEELERAMEAAVTIDAMLRQRLGL